MTIHFFSIFKRKKIQEKKPALVIEEAFASIGVKVEIAEIENVMNKAPNMIQFEPSRPTQLEVARFAELERSDSGYIFHGSFELLDGAGNLGDSGRVYLLIACHYITVSEIAYAKGLPDFTIQKGQRLGLGDIKCSDYLHPIHQLLPTMMPREIV